MSTISAAAVNELRKRTDLPLMECKKALTEAAGDIEKAIGILRSQFAKAAVKREGNEAAEGRVGIFIDAAAKTAAIVELRCESAPSAKSDQFVALAADVAKQVAQKNPADVAALLAQPSVTGSGTVQDRINETVGLIREKMIVHQFARLSGDAFGQYVHHDGTVGALIACTGGAGNDETLRDVCAHIAAMNPRYMVSTEIPADTLEKEKTLAIEQLKTDPKNANKPANILEKIIEGKMKAWMSETVLTEQPMANGEKYPGKTVGQVLQGLKLTPVKFVRYKVGATSV